jgi:trehalose 6-phosphate phosphatase
LPDLAALSARVRRAPTVRLLIDYDGTLADFTPRPGMILPDAEIQRLFRRLVRTRNLLPAIISGRPLSDIQALVPVEGVLRAGTYGLELELPGEGVQYALSLEQVQALMRPLRARWQALIAGQPQFYLEDKQWALALHTPRQRSAEDEAVYAAAQAATRELRPDPAVFAVFDDGHLLELAPLRANKALSAGWILANQSPGAALSIYLGDDAHDAAAMAVVQAAGGEAIQVGSRVKTNAHYHVETPAAARAWLQSLTEPGTAG